MFFTGLLARGGRAARGSAAAFRGRRRGDARRNLDAVERARAARSGRRSRPATPQAFGGADARALAAKARALVGECHRRDQHAGTRRDGERRARRQAHRRRRRRLPALLRRAIRSRCARRWPRGATGGALRLRPRRLDSDRPVTMQCVILAGGSRRGSALRRGELPKALRARSPAARSPTTSSTWLAEQGVERGRATASATAATRFAHYVGDGSHWVCRSRTSTRGRPARHRRRAAPGVRRRRARRSLRRPLRRLVPAARPAKRLRARSRPRPCRR